MVRHLKLLVNRNLLSYIADLMKGRVPKRPAPAKTMLRKRFWCPFSGLEIDGQRIDQHSIPVIVCSNGTLMGYCSRHETRIFVRESSIVAILRRDEVPATANSAHELKEDP